jgi:hypothetical protein
MDVSPGALPYPPVIGRALPSPQAMPLPACAGALPQPPVPGRAPPSPGHVTAALGRASPFPGRPVPFPSRPSPAMRQPLAAPGPTPSTGHAPARVACGGGRVLPTPPDRGRPGCCGARLQSLHQIDMVSMAHGLALVPPVLDCEGRMKAPNPLMSSITN